jgi:hypothetical protein
MFVPLLYSINAQARLCSASVINALQMQNLMSFSSHNNAVLGRMASKCKKLSFHRIHTLIIHHDVFHRKDYCFVAFARLGVSH